MRSPAGHHELSGQSRRKQLREQEPPPYTPSRGAPKGSGWGHKDAEKRGFSPLQQDPNIYALLRPAG